MLRNALLLLHGKLRRKRQKSAINIKKLKTMNKMMEEKFYAYKGILGYRILNGFRGKKKTEKTR